MFSRAGAKVARKIIADAPFFALPACFAPSREPGSTSGGSQRAA
jgi:hypothetical protein